MCLSGLKQVPRGGGAWAADRGSTILHGRNTP
jgi:hypothetical protein